MLYTISYAEVRTEVDAATGATILVRGNVKMLTKRWSTLFPLEKLMTEWSGYFTGEKKIPGHVVLCGSLVGDDGAAVQSFDNQTIPPSVHSDGGRFAGALRKLAEEKQRERAKVAAVREGREKILSLSVPLGAN